MKFIVNQFTDKFSFILTTDDGKTLASSLDFSSQEACIEAIRVLTARLSDVSTYRFSDKSFSLLLNGLNVAKSPEYETSVVANAAMNDLMNDAKEEAKYEVQLNTQLENKQSKFVDVPSLSDIIYASLYDFEIASVLGIPGFEPVVMEDDSYTFLYNDTNGKGLVYSRKFDSVGKRDKRIRQLIKSSAKNERFEIIEDNETYYFIIKAANQAEIARSITFETKAEAEGAVEYCMASMNSFEGQYPEPAKKAKKGTAYNFKINPDSGQLGFYALQDESKDFYFVLNGDNGRPILFSPGYASGSSRDNGIKTVIRNAIMKDQHDIREANGKYFFVLCSENRQEIARSAHFVSVQEAKEQLEWTLANAQSYAENYGVVVETTVMQTQTESFVIDVELPKNDLTGRSNEDEYLDCDAYTNRIDTPLEGFRTFSVDGEYYFSMVNPDGDVLLRSEGYPAVDARDNGLASVQENREIKERFSVVEDNGEYFVILKAANHKEIARSCGYRNQSALFILFPFLDAGHGGGIPWEIVGISASAATITPLANIEARVSSENDEVTPADTSPAENFIPIAESPANIENAEVDEEDSPMTGLAAAVGAAAVTVGSVAGSDNVESNVIPPVAASPAAASPATGGLIPRWLWALLGAVLLAALLWWLLRDGSAAGGDEVPYKNTADISVITPSAAIKKYTKNALVLKKINNGIVCVVI